MKVIQMTSMYLVLILSFCTCTGIVYAEPRQPAYNLTEEEKVRLNQDVTELDELILQTPDDAKLWVYKANALFNLHDYEEALIALDEAERLESDNVNASVIRGNTLFMLGRDDEALASFDKAIAIDPDNIAVIEGKQAILTILGNGSP